MNERLVALDVDDATHGGGTAKLLEGFPQAVGAAGVVGAGEDRLAAKILDVTQDSVVVGGHHHPRQVGLSGLGHHPLNHALPAQVNQWFARQSGRSETSRNEADDHVGCEEVVRYRTQITGEGRAVAPAGIKQECLRGLR